jgi:hypothetical protein
MNQGEEKGKRKRREKEGKDYFRQFLPNPFSV